MRLVAPAITLGHAHCLLSTVYCLLSTVYCLLIRCPNWRFVMA
ncbi:MAG: hypothetical protein U9Q74_07515 [Gemmatimonadota bacterium]|nr:hypothetical protein [Gemmatimonadota bacterium]